MLYLLWGLLNIGLFIFFILTCLKATKLIKEKIGIFAAIIFVLGLLSFVSQSGIHKDNHEPNSDRLRTWKFDPQDSLDKNSSYYLEIELAKTLISKQELGIEYGKDKQALINIPISANSWTEGFVSGTNWVPSAIAVNKTSDNNRFEYFVSGVVEWRLLGLTVYSQSKEYTGFAKLK